MSSKIKINQNDKEKPCHFDDVPLNSFFLYAGVLWIKTLRSNESLTKKEYLSHSVSGNYGCLQHSKHMTHCTIVDVEINIVD